MRKAIAFSSRRLAASESSRLTNVLVGGIETNNNRRIVARYGITVSLHEAYCNVCYGGGQL